MLKMYVALNMAAVQSLRSPREAWVGVFAAFAVTCQGVWPYCLVHYLLQSLCSTLIFSTLLAAGMPRELGGSNAI
jgi:hypothetical protein